MYYPMRMIRTRTHKYILNLALARAGIPRARPGFIRFTDMAGRAEARRQDARRRAFPLATPTCTDRARSCTIWKRTSTSWKNVAADPKYAGEVLADPSRRARLKEWQVKTKDPWLIKYQHE